MTTFLAQVPPYFLASVYSIDRIVPRPPETTLLTAAASEDARSGSKWIASDRVGYGATLPSDCVGLRRRRGDPAVGLRRTRGRPRLPTPDWISDALL